MTAPPRPTLMRRTVSASLRFRFIVVAAAVGMMVFGTVALPAMRIDVFPEFAPPRVEIQTLCMGLTTADVESLVTVPLEQALNGVDGLDDLRSKSVPQLSSIELIFKPGTDLLEARQLVAERLDTVVSSLPTWAAPPVMLPPVSATGRAVQIGMSSKDHSLIAMSMMAYWTIRARILRVPGVANVALWGERLQLMTVQVKPGKMREQNVSLDTVMEATADSVDSGLLRFSNGSVIGAGGFVDAPNQRISVRSVLPIVTPADMAKVPVEQRGGHTVRIGDVAHVAETHQPLIGDAVIGDGPGLLLVVEKLPWADSSKVTRDVEKVIKDLQPGMQGVQFDTHIFQQARFIDTAIHNLREALVLGFLLVVVILFLFLFEWRVALISLVTIPLSLMATMLVLYWRGDDREHDDPGGAGDRARSRGRRRHHRRREHPETAPPGAGGGKQQVDRLHHPRRVAGGPEPDRLRDADHRRRGAAGLPAVRPHRRLLPASRGVLHARHPRVDGSGTDGHPRTVPDPAAQGPDAPGFTGGALAAPRLLHRRARPDPRRVPGTSTRAPLCWWSPASSSRPPWASPCSPPSRNATS